MSKPTNAAQKAGGLAKSELERQRREWIFPMVARQMLAHERPPTGRKPLSKRKLLDDIAKMVNASLAIDEEPIADGGTLAKMVERHPGEYEAALALARRDFQAATAEDGTVDPEITETVEYWKTLKTLSHDLTGDLNKAYAKLAPFKGVHAINDMFDIETEVRSLIRRMTRPDGQ